MKEVITVRVLPYVPGEAIQSHAVGVELVKLSRFPQRSYLENAVLGASLSPMHDYAIRSTCMSVVDLQTIGSLTLVRVWIRR